MGLSLDQLEKLYLATTKGPWCERFYQCGFKNGDGHKSIGNEKHGDVLFGGLYWNNLEFIAAIHNEFPALLARIREAEEALGFYAGLRVEVIRDCSGGMSEVPHRVNLYDTARAYFTKYTEGK